MYICMYTYYISFSIHSENQCPTTHPMTHQYCTLSSPVIMVAVTPGYTGMPTLRTFGQSFPHHRLWME